MLAAQTLESGQRVSGAEGQPSVSASASGVSPTNEKVLLEHNEVTCTRLSGSVCCGHFSQVRRQAEESETNIGFSVKIITIIITISPHRHHCHHCQYCHYRHHCLHCRHRHGYQAHYRMKKSHHGGWTMSRIDFVTADSYH